MNGPRSTSAVAVRDAGVRRRKEPAAAENATVGFAGSLIRPDDQVRITFDLVNGAVDATSNTIQPLLGEEPIYYVISFGSQHISEQTVGAADTPPDAALAHRRAAASRVSVEIPAGTAFTVGNLLDLAAFALHVDPRADGAPNDDPASLPATDVTSIEIPASLILSPESTGPNAGRFSAEPAPITHGDVSEVWRARLVTAGGDPAARSTLRAIARSHDDPPFPADDRHFDLLVTQTCGPDGVPLTVGGLTLSSQGATLDVEGAWAGVDLAAYRHRAITGRDIRIEVVLRGFIAPFGHPASLSTLTERQLRDDASGDLTATLTEDTYLAIAEPVVSYPADDSILMPYAGRRLPFTSIAAADNGRGPVVRENVVMPNGSKIRRDRACVLTRDGDDLVLSYTATDRNGNAVTFELPAVFVADSVAYEVLDDAGTRTTVLAKLATWYAEAAADSRRELQLGGQAVAWADPSPRGGAGSAQATNRIRIAFDRPALNGADPADASDMLREVGRPAFYPGVETAWVVDQSSATALGGDPPEVEVTIAQRWLDHGLGELNVDLGYLDLAAPSIIVPATDALGMLAASLNVDTFGQFLGAGFKFPGVGGGAWEWNPLDALGDIGGGLPKLLGSLDLTDLIPPVDIAGLEAPEGLPALRVEPQFDGGTPPIPTGVCFHFDWEPKVRSFPATAEQPTFVVTDDFDDPLPDPGQVFDDPDDRGTRVSLALTACVPQATTTFEARLERFALQLPPGAPVVAICFQHVTYRNDNGTSTVDTDIADWLFIGALNWLEPLKDFLAGLLGNGASTFEGGIFVDYGLPIPSFSIGVLGVSGMRVDLGLDLPDSGASSVDLEVGRRDDPFRITIMGFGGDGSFGLEVDAREIVLIEGSLAVTYELAVDIFIASASLSASVGVFIVYDDGTVTLGAYVELRGSVSALGLLEISGAVTVALIYNVNRQLLRGIAAVTGEVSSIFGKSEVTHDVEVEVALGDGGAAKRFALLAAPLANGAVHSDLSFGDRFTKPQWTTYCAAFAA
jgi:hypothetical protein